MIRLGHHQFSLMILYAISLHYLWAIGLAIDLNAAHATAVAVFMRLLEIPPEILPAVFFLVATLALSGLMYGNSDMFSIALMLPQQCMLMMSAYGAVHAAYIGQFGDGVQRSHVFILLDQAPAIIAAMGHTLAIIGIGQRWKH